MIHSRTFQGDLVKAILDDLNDRRGLRQRFETIDEETQQEIVDCWENLAQAAISKARKAEMVRIAGHLDSAAALLEGQAEAATDRHLQGGIAALRRHAADIRKAGEE